MKKYKKDLMLLPGYLLVSVWVLFAIFLIGWIILASFSTTKEIFTNSILDSGFHFDSYVRAWTVGNLSVYFMNSIIYSTVAITGTLLISAPSAYALSRFEFKFNSTIQKLFIMALSVPSVMLVLPLYSLAVRLGIINSRVTLIVIYTCLFVPFTTFFLLNFFSTLPKSFEEAAAIDGCSPIKTFYKIMLPLAQPGMITVGIFLFVAVWNEYFIALIFATDTSIRPLSVGLYTMIQGMRYTGDWAGLFASVVIVFIPTFILYIFLSQKIIAGVTGGGVKE